MRIDDQVRPAPGGQSGGARPQKFPVPPQSVSTVLSRFERERVPRTVLVYSLYDADAFHRRRRASDASISVGNVPPPRHRVRRVLGRGDFLPPELFRAPPPNGPERMLANIFPCRLGSGTRNTY